MSDYIRVDRKDGIGTITIDRPAQHNAINYDMWLELGQAAETLGADGEVKVVVLTGAGGKAFSAGADIKDFPAHRSTSALAKEYAAAFEGAHSFRKKLFADYKANRTSPPDDLKVQFEYCRRITEAVGIASFEVETYEADDVLGSIAVRMADEQGLDMEPNEQRIAFTQSEDLLAKRSCGFWAVELVACGSQSGLHAILC